MSPEEERRYRQFLRQLIQLAARTTDYIQIRSLGDVALSRRAEGENYVIVWQEQTTDLVHWWDPASNYLVDAPPWLTPAQLASLIHAALTW